MLPVTFESHEGRRLRVARLGAGPPIVLLHGYPDNLQIWCELAQRLAQAFEVIAFDWPGTGYSEPWPGGATPFHLADRLLALLDRWRIPRAAIAGMDMGGQPALAFAARYPERLTHLAVMNSLVMWDEATSWEIRILRKFAWNRFVLRYFPGAVFRRALRTFLPRGCSLPDDLRADLWQSFRAVPVRRFIARMCAGYQGALPKLAQLYPSIAAPTLVLWAECDKHFPPEHARRLHAQLPRSQLEIVVGAEHWMPWYLADDIANRIQRFVQGTGARDTGS